MKDKKEVSIGTQITVATLVIIVSFFALLLLIGGTIPNAGL